MISVNFMDNSEHARTIYNWLSDYENENGKGINRTRVPLDESLDGMGIYALENDKLIGGLTYRIQNDWIFLACGYVLPEYRGRRIYSTFLYELEQMAVRRNLSGIFVSTYTFEAPHVYEHLGFTKGAVLDDLPKGNTNIDYYKHSKGGISRTMSVDTRQAALILVDNERNRQDAKWGEQNHDPQYWVGILGEEYGEYCQAVNETVFNNGPVERAKGGADNMIRELSHVAAVAVGAIECLMRGKEDKS